MHGQMEADLREAHCGLGLPQSMHFLLSSSSFLMSSCSMRFATAWSMVRGVSWRGEARLPLCAETAGCMPWE